MFSLTAACHPFDDHGGQSPAAEVYSMLTARGAGRIPSFDPASSTKFLHFAQGFRCRPAIPHPGRRRRPGPQGRMAGSRQGCVVSGILRALLRALGRWAEQAAMALDGSRTVRADEIELKLFRRLNAR